VLTILRVSVNTAASTVTAPTPVSVRPWALPESYPMRPASLASRLREKAPATLGSAVLTATVATVPKLLAAPQVPPW
jgi:hypothetical protein